MKLKLIGLSRMDYSTIQKKPYIEAIESPDRLIEVFRSSHRVFVVILVEMFDKLKRDAGIETEPIEKVQVGHWEYVLISNH
jgi:hypothetical protein